MGDPAMNDDPAISVHMSDPPPTAGAPVPAAAGGTPPREPPQPPPPTTSTDDRYISVMLPSGRTAKLLRKGKGRHMRDASRAVGKDQGNAMAFTLALIAVKTTIDGRGITYEDMLDMDEDDVTALMAAQGAEGKAPGSSPPAT